MRLRYGEQHYDMISDPASRPGRHWAPPPRSSVQMLLLLLLLLLPLPGRPAPRAAAAAADKVQHGPQDVPELGPEGLAHEAVDDEVDGGVDHQKEVGRAQHHVEGHGNVEPGNKRTH